MPVPEVLKFKPELAGIPQSISLELLSSLSIQVALGEPYYPDPRFTFERRVNVIQGANGSSHEVFIVKFDPGKFMVKNQVQTHVFGS